MAADDELPRQIGSRVKALRSERGLSGRKLAAAAGVSQPFLSQLESGQTSVAIATLYRIAGALGVGPADLLESPPNRDVEVVRAPEIRRMPLSEEADSATDRVVFRSGKRITELGDILIEPGQHHEDWYTSRAELVVYVLEGSIRIEFEGHPDVTLDAGDVAFHSGEIRSRWHLESATPARVVMVAAGD